MAVKFGVWARCEDGSWTDQEPTDFCRDFMGSRDHAPPRDCTKTGAPESEPGGDVEIPLFVFSRPTQT